MKSFIAMRTLIISILVVALPAAVFAGTTRIQLVGNIATVPQQQQLSIASASASSGEGAYTADKAIDNNTGTRWGSAFVEPSWITLDLGSAQDLQSVVIDWETASAATYEIRGSNNNSTWTTLASESGGISQNHRIDTVSISGNYRYVQMYGLTRNTVYGFSIWEMDVYGVSTGGTDTDNDGVVDSFDQCPGTPADTPVQSDGCEFGVFGGYDAPTSYPGYSLVWSDEFNGTALNTADWTHEIGDGCPSLCGWGNSELQYYRAENTTVANGVLMIETKNESFGNRNYTSSRLKTQGKQFFKYGRIDIRAVLPQGSGPWPALWMLGESINTVGWPASGEIDIMEKRGGIEDEVLGTAHWDNNGSYALYGCENAGTCPTLASGTFADEFHVFSIVWDAQFIRWYLDGATTAFHTIDITPAALSEFREDFFLLINTAVGGNLGGTPNNAIFPQTMYVDYVRVYQ